MLKLVSCTRVLASCGWWARETFCVAPGVSDVRTLGLDDDALSEVPGLQYLLNTALSLASSNYLTTRCGRAGGAADGECARVGVGGLAYVNLGGGMRDWWG